MSYIFFIFLLLNPLHIVAVKDDKLISQTYTTGKYNLRARPTRPPKKTATVTTKKEPIPDLNFPPPIEEEQIQKKAPKPRRESYAQRIERHKKDGTLEAYKEAERIRKKAYKAQFTPEQLKEKSRKWEESRRAKIATVSKSLIYKI